MNSYSKLFESYLIPAEEGILGKVLGSTHTMYVGTYPNIPAGKFKSLSDLQKASTQFVYKDKLNALLAEALTYGNTIDRKTNVITLTPNSAKTLLDKKITLYEVKCKRIEFYKYSEKHPTDCYTTSGKDIIEYKEIGEYKVSDIFKRVGAKIQDKNVTDKGSRKHILNNIISLLRKEADSNSKINNGIMVYQHNEIDDYDDFIDGDIDSAIIARIEGPHDPDQLAEFGWAVDKLVKSINDKLINDSLYKNWKISDDWDKNEGFISVDKKG